MEPLLDLKYEIIIFVIAPHFNTLTICNTLSCWGNRLMKKDIINDTRKEKLKNIGISGLDYVLSFVLLPSIFLLKKYRTIGARRLRKTTTMLRKIGVFPVIDHYYEPMFKTDQLIERYIEKRELPGIDYNKDYQLELLHKFEYQSEIKGLKEKSSKYPVSYSPENHLFAAGDADMLYNILRYHSSKRVIEVGSGYSTMIARMALEANDHEDVKCGSDRRSLHICIEPYEQPWLREIKEIDLIRKRVEELDLSLFNVLESGDLLFIDSSHIIRPGGDVLKIFLEIIPMLNRGVIVHVHDIFTPRDYSYGHRVEDIRFWNEQYILEALLTNSLRYEVIMMMNMQMHENYNALKNACPLLGESSEPGSIYFRVR